MQLARKQCRVWAIAVDADSVDVQVERAASADVHFSLCSNLYCLRDGGIGILDDGAFHAARRERTIGLVAAVGEGFVGNGEAQRGAGFRQFAAGESDEYQPLIEAFRLLRLQTWDGQWPLYHLDSALVDLANVAALGQAVIPTLGEEVADEHRHKLLDLNGQ